MTEDIKSPPDASNYGYTVPAGSRADPSRGHAMERDALPPDADFSKPITTETLTPPPAQVPAQPTPAGPVANRPR